MNTNINWAKHFISASILVGILGCTSCNTKTVTDTDITHSSRDNIVEVKDLVHPFDTDTIIISGNASIYVNDDHLFFKESEPTEAVVYAFNPETLEFQGAFGKPGPAPTEILVPGAMALNDEKGEAYIVDHGQLKIMAFNVDSAITRPDYTPWVRQIINGGKFPDRYVYVNDTLTFCRYISVKPDGNSFTQKLGVFNFNTGELTEFAPGEHPDDKCRTLFALSAKDNLLVEVGSNVDQIKIYDFEGNVIRRIKGPEYSEVPGRKCYFRSAAVTNDYILALYSGDADYFTEKLLVMSHDGEYLATLDLGYEVSLMAYSSKLNRLYLMLNDETEQFGYIDLNGLDDRI